MTTLTAKQVFDIVHPNQPVNADGTMTTIITTLQCCDCGRVDAFMDHTFATLVHGPIIHSHETICDECLESGDYY